MSGDSRARTAESGRRRSHDVVVSGLRQRIADGELRQGQHLPTQASLSTEYAVPRGAVRRALEVLEEEGLITRARQGTSATVARPEHVTRTAGVELRERIAHAFRQPHVRVDAYCGTGETLHWAFSEPVIKLTAGTIRAPRSIHLRLLLPDSESLLALPQAVDDPASPGPRRLLGEVMDHMHAALHHSLRMLAVRGLVPDVRVERRAIAITPTQRVFILNGEEVLTGPYRVTRRVVDIGGASAKVYDTLGMDAMLFRHTVVDGDDPTREYVQQMCLWFDSLWDSIARAPGPDAGPPADGAGA